MFEIKKIKVLPNNSMLVFSHTHILTTPWFKNNLDKNTSTRKFKLWLTNPTIIFKTRLKMNVYIVAKKIL